MTEKGGSMCPHCVVTWALGVMAVMPGLRYFYCKMRGGDKGAQ